MGKKSRGKKDKTAKKERKEFERLVSGLEDLADLDLIDVDEYGWPVGKDGEALAATILTVLDNRAEEAGWDQPHAIIEVIRSDVSAALEPDLRDQLEMIGPEEDDPAGNPKRLFIFTEKTFDGEPTPVLWTHWPSDPTMALAIQREVYVAPINDPAIRPSQHPDREELRMIDLYTRSGREYSITRWRDGRTRVLVHDKPSEQGCLAFAVLKAPIPADWPRLPLPKYLDNLLHLTLVGYYAQTLQPAAAAGLVDLEPDLLADLMYAYASAFLWPFARTVGTSRTISPEAVEQVFEYDAAIQQWWAGNQLEPLVLSEKAAKFEPVMRSVIQSATWQEARRVPEFYDMAFVAKVLPGADFEPREWDNEDFFEALTACMYPDAIHAPHGVRNATWTDAKNMITRSLDKVPAEVRHAVKKTCQHFAQQ